MKLTQQQKDDHQKMAAKLLLELIPKGSTIYTVLLHRTRNQMKGVVAVLVVDKGEIRNISSHVSWLIPNYKWDDRDGVWANNQFDVVMNMSYHLHGYKLPARSKFKAGYTFNHKAL